MSENARSERTPRYRSETDIEIETRTRAEMADNQPTKLWVLGPYEIAALLRQLDRERGEHFGKAIEWAVAKERQRCAQIADEYSTEILPVDPGGVARLIAGRIRERNS